MKLHENPPQGSNRGEGGPGGQGRGGGGGRGGRGRMVGGSGRDRGRRDYLHDHSSTVQLVYN